MKRSHRRLIPSESIARYFTPPLPTPAIGVPPATLAEYLDRARFPLTPLPGLSPREQFLIDGYELDRLREFLRAGGTLTEEEWHRLTELEDKAAARTELIAELGEADI